MYISTNIPYVYMVYMVCMYMYVCMCVYVHQLMRYKECFIGLLVSRQS